jgi:hypothetical protein
MPETLETPEPELEEPELELPVEGEFETEG